ncbi:hypothetical protein [Azospirillum melinis]
MVSTQSPFAIARRFVQVPRRACLRWGMLRRLDEERVNRRQFLPGARQNMPSAPQMLQPCDRAATASSATPGHNATAEPRHGRHDSDCATFGKIIPRNAREECGPMTNSPIPANRRLPKRGIWSSQG